MSLSSYDIHTFLEIFESKNLSRSSEKLAVSQPALSMHLKRLEAYFGVPLFLRTKQGLQPTKAADHLAQEARQLARELETLRERVSRQEQGIEGTYTLGFHPQVAAYSFPKFATPLLTKHENFNLKLVYDTSRRILSDVVDYKVDFAIVVDPIRHPELTIVKLYDNTIRFWSLEKPTKLQTLADPLSIVFCARSLPQMEALLVKASQRKVGILRRAIDTTDLDVIREFVARGLGVGILPDTIAEKNLHDHLVPLNDLPSFAEQICLIYRSDLQKSQAAKFIRGTIVEAFKTKVQG